VEVIGLPEDGSSWVRIQYLVAECLHHQWLGSWNQRLLSMLFDKVGEAVLAGIGWLDWLMRRRRVVSTWFGGIVTSLTGIMGAGEEGGAFGLITLGLGEGSMRAIWCSRMKLRH
jgi:hypothetical protein